MRLESIRQSHCGTSKVGRFRLCIQAPFGEQSPPNACGAQALPIRPERLSSGIARQPGEGVAHGRGPMARLDLALLARRERTDRDVISVRISERELIGLSVRIHVWLLFEASDKRSCPLKRHVEIIDTEEQQEAVAGYPAIGAHQ